MRLFIENYVKKVAPLVKKANLAYWEASVTGNPEKYKEAAKYEFEIAKLHSNREEFLKLREFLKEDIKDELLKRQIVLIYLSYAGKQGDPNLVKQIIDKQNEIEEKFNTFRAELNGKKVTDNELKEILRSEKKNMALRKEAWLASKQIGKVVAKDVLELAKLRNKLAKSLGYKDYFEMALKLQEQTPEEIIGLFDKLDNEISPEYQKVKADIDKMLARRYKISSKSIMPWHYEDPFFQEGISFDSVNLDKYYKGKDLANIAKDFYASIGLDVTDILERSSLYEKEGKMQHAFCTDIDREGDVRILTNIKDNESWMDTVLHELGHAVYDKYLDKNLPYVLREACHTFTTEAVAMLFGRQSKNPEFLKKYCGLSDREAKNIAPQLYKMQKFQQLVFSRWCQVVTRFEKEMYAHPEKGVDYFNNYWWQLKEKYQLIKKPKDRNNPDWAAKIHISAYPVYYHNYMLGELFASQMNFYIAKNIIHTDNIKQTFLGDNKEIGKYFIEKIFKPGARYRWDRFVKEATGDELNPKYYKLQFVD
ncbi:peptidyl-dipeptidase A [Thermotomaculum hydrothermale]|uniref:Peptidyl-dipeptidase A n=2 Tax=Thermotomaculum hydrothermale TaxID=981385 RepID=A0A7R6PXP3_9BACT|nr:peptidyl-dipeptidase A [Thermotomaculum hydrothermale]